MRAAVVISFCLFLGLSAFPAATVGTVTSSTPLRLGAHNEPIVGVLINGRGPFPFILDTGSTHSSIATSLATALNAPIVARATVTSSLGQEIQPVVSLATLAVGPISANQVLATQVQDDRLGNKTEVRGVLGQDVLSNLVYTLDFGAKRIEWNPNLHGASSHPSSVLNLRSTQGRFLAELPQTHSTLWLVPDSGAEALVLYKRPDLRLPPLTGSRGQAILSTVSDQRAVEIVHVSQLVVGHTNLTDVPAVLVKHDTEDDRSLGDGLLPLAIFERVTFDGPGQRLIVEP
jgi:predicted aspartyl protease